MRVGVVRFPGSCDERDTVAALATVAEPVLLWHQERDLKGADAVILPGGFSYGDYLRPGALARFAPVMEAVSRFAEAGGPVLGICNGFQVLCEAGLLPGVLLPNATLRFRCVEVELDVINRDLPFTCACSPILRLPAKHGAGRYYAPPDLLARLEAEGRVALRYAQGHNFNGSSGAVAGVANKGGNVMGMMPHPEHALGLGGRSADGTAIFRSLARTVARANGG